MKKNGKIRAAFDFQPVEIPLDNLIETRPIPRAEKSLNNQRPSESAASRGITRANEEQARALYNVYTGFATEENAEEVLTLRALIY